MIIYFKKTLTSLLVHLKLYLIMSPPSQDFFVGYLPKMPVGIKKFLRLWIGVLVVLLPLLAYVLVSSQIGFSTATFELGTLTELEGILITHPVPMLRIASEPDKNGERAYQDILLIGFGKNGAEEDISVWEKQAGHSLEEYWVEVSGTLIYHNGKTLLELTEGKRALKTVKNEAKKERVGGMVKGEIGSWKGEIIDPKCYFGVMKPGRAKPHRSCAALCIAGGIPPVLRVSNAQEQVKYFLLMGADYTSINEQVKPFIAEGVEIQGQVSHRNGWDFIQIANLRDIKRVHE